MPVRLRPRETEEKTLKTTIKSESDRGTADHKFYINFLLRVSSVFGALHLRGKRTRDIETFLLFYYICGLSEITVCTALTTKKLLLFMSKQSFTCLRTAGRKNKIRFFSQLFTNLTLRFTATKETCTQGE